MADQFTLYGNQASGPTYKVGLMLALSGQKFAFKHVDLRAGEHKTPAFLALNRYGQVPVLSHNARNYCQSAAILQHLARELGKFGSKDREVRARIREWLYWDADRLVPGIYRTRAILRGVLNAGPEVETYFRGVAEAGLSVLEQWLGKSPFLVGDTPTIADIACFGVCWYAPEAKIELGAKTNIGAWMARIEKLPGFKKPYDLLPAQDLAA